MKLNYKAVFFRLTGMLPLISFFGNHYNRLETWIYMRKDVYMIRCFSKMSHH